MPEEIEVETKELQETIDELREERGERDEAVRKDAWTRWIGLSTALLAVFAAIGALQSGALVNEAMMSQLRASDTWNEYQAARLKEHLYTVEANSLLDRGAKAGSIGAGAATQASAGAGEPKAGATTATQSAKPEHAAKPAHATGGGHGEATKAVEPPRRDRRWKTLSADARLGKYITKVTDESSKQEEKHQEATKYEAVAVEKMHQHHKFANSVAFIQVAIALSAVAALTKMKSVWLVSLGAGAMGIFQFAMGFYGH